MSSNASSIEKSGRASSRKKRPKLAPSVTVAKFFLPYGRLCSRCADDEGTVLYTSLVQVVFLKLISMTLSENRSLVWKEKLSRMYDKDSRGFRCIVDVTCFRGCVDPEGGLGMFVGLELFQGKAFFRFSFVMKPGYHNWWLKIYPNERYHPLGTHRSVSERIDWAIVFL